MEDQKEVSVKLPLIMPVNAGEASPVPSPQRYIYMTRTSIAEKRIIEAKTVNPVTYAELEYVFNESYRELKANSAAIGFEIGNAEKAISNRKAELLLDLYPEFLKDKPAKFDNAEIRNSFVNKDAEYQRLLDVLNDLKLLQALTDGKIKVMERVTAYMKKQIDILLKSGFNSNLYVK